MLWPALFASGLLACTSGQAPAPTDDAAAADAAAPADDAALYAEVDAIITPSCARQTCHGAMVANAHMDLMANGWRAALVGVPSCEYDRMQRVEPGKPEQSWIMVKLTGPVRFRQYQNFIDFEPDSDWKPSTPECSGSFDDGAPWFGTPMPPPETTTITGAQVETIRRWIEAGAPGPGR